MFKNDSGKLMVYAYGISSSGSRLQSVRTAAEKTAKQLNMSFELVPQQSSCSQIYVYYGEGGDEPVPIYCDEGKKGDLREIQARLRNMMFVLSFHPKHAALRHIRAALFTPS